jgi:hypothetical protein
MTITLCSVAMAVGALACNPAAAGTSPPATGLCTVGVGVGVRRGTVVEPCKVDHRTALGSIPTHHDTQSLPPSPAQDLMVKISSFNTHQILMIDALRLMIP